MTAISLPCRSPRVASVMWLTQQRNVVYTGTTHLNRIVLKNKYLKTILRES